jgi:hypothetical protein
MKRKAIARDKTILRSSRTPGKKDLTILEWLESLIVRNAELLRSQTSMEWVFQGNSTFLKSYH